ncbi:hypothetical protein Poli38472_008366 [Pythium oligandrum]|uniref:VPS9 domain-containing protein n=1 Tax=Pythium oligandrum TaxID=41045 RepID=A0A8K1CLI1_PYTOL|nr:hypothetical protein Poli38472_008366 [Pythium oligandrum]|eukprot:TMW65724.1 hypothetical protein Poli38472_008366 [Pythium oligandrum]
MDLEDELMDLESNESAYLPQAAHSMPPPSISVNTKPIATENRVSPALKSPVLPSKPPSPPSSWSSSHSSAETVTCSPSGEEPLGWYDHVEMLLATAEAKYMEWQDQVELQGSFSAEEYRVAEEARVERRRRSIQALTQQRKSVIHDHFAAFTGSGNGVEDVDVEELVAKLSKVIAQSTTRQEQTARETIWTHLVEDLPREERDYVAKAGEEMFIEKMKYKRDQEETKTLIHEYLQDVFRWHPPKKNGQHVGRVMNHSLGQTMREFAEIFHACYGSIVTSTRVDALTSLLPLVAADVNQFAAILVQVVLYKYRFLSRVWQALVHRCILDALFEHLQPTLHGLYVAAFAREDAFVRNLAQLLRTSRLDRFGIKTLFRLDDSWRLAKSSVEVDAIQDANEQRLKSLRQYDPLVHKLNAFPSLRSPWSKAELIANVCRDVDRTIKAYYATWEASLRPSQEQLNIAADDLSALLSFVLVSAPAACSHVVTQLAILGCNLPGESAKGEEGFAVATLSAAVTHLCHLT